MVSPRCNPADTSFALSPDTTMTTSPASSPREHPQPPTHAEADADVVRPPLPALLKSSSTPNMKGSLSAHFARIGRAPRKLPAAGDTPSTTDDDSMPSMRVAPPMLSTNSNRLESQMAVTGLLQHFQQFALKLHEASEHDVSELKGDVTQVEAWVTERFDQESEEREKATSSLEKRCDALERALAALHKERSEGSDPVKQRLDDLESTFGAWADKHTRDVESLRKAGDGLGREFAAWREAHEQHLDVEASLDSAVKGLTSAAEQTAKALAAAKAKLDHMHSEVLGCEERCGAVETYGNALEERLRDAEKRLDAGVGACSKDVEILKSSHQNLSAQVAQKLSETDDAIARHAASHREMAARHEASHKEMDTAVRGLSSSADRTAKALAATKAKLDDAHQTAVGCEERCAAAEDRNALLADRLKDAERRLEDKVKGCSRDVEALRGDHVGLSSELAKRLSETDGKLESHAASHKQSLDAAVRVLTSSSEQTAAALAATKSKVDSMHDGALGCEQRCAAMESKTSALETRLEHTHGRLESTVSTHARELESLKDGHHGLSLQVKQKLGEANDLINHHASTHKARIDSQEQSHGALAARHEGQARDLRTLRDDHAKHGQELGLLRRNVEGALGELSHNTTQELQATRDELDQVRTLLAGVQQAWVPRGCRPGSAAASPQRARTPKGGLGYDPLKPGLELSPSREHL